MRLLVASEQRFLQGQSGQLYANGPARYGMWANYLEAFDEVRILARVAAEPRARAGEVESRAQAEAAEANAREEQAYAAGAKACAEEARADGPRVSFVALPDYRGPWEYLLKRSELKRRVREAIDECDAYILRVPGLVGGLVWHELRRRKKPFALEVVGDPWDAFGPGTWPGVFRPAFRRVATRELKAMCLEASAVHYVTRSTLQRRYPAAKNAYTVGFSDALMDSAFATREELEERFRRIDEIVADAATIRHTGSVGDELPRAKAQSTPDKARSHGLKAMLPPLKWGASTPESRLAPPRRAGTASRHGGQVGASTPESDSSGIAGLSHTDIGETNEADRETRRTGRFRVGFVGSLSQMYKGPDVLLRAVADCLRRGLNVEAALLGEGRCIDAMRSLASDLGIAERTQFLGQLPAGKPVFAFLDSVDLFVMPSRSEGLPRALLEAMARGCPCIGSEVGGIPELLPAEDMVPVSDARALAEKVMEVTAGAARMKEMAMRNIEKAKEFSPELLRDLRREFCRVVRERAEGG